MFLRALELLRGGRRPIDYLIAACAEAADDVNLWHWRSDFTTICEFADIAHEPAHARAKASGPS